MEDRLCRYCQKAFEPSKYRPDQAVCGDAICQRRRRTEYHRDKIASDPDYRQVCLDSPRKWRASHPGYWKQYRDDHPDAVERNRLRQRQRDEKRRLRDLANNNLVFDLKRSAAEVWLVGPGCEHLANNNVAIAQILVFTDGIRRGTPLPASCQQQPSGSPADSAP